MYVEVLWLADGLARIVVAITGGVFLPVPMIGMTRATDVHMRLAVVSVAVLWFADSVALGSRATNQELVAATAAYSAVMWERRAVYLFERRGMYHGRWIREDMDARP